MYTCYDCELLGNGCEGILPPPEYSHNIEKYCKKFILVKWRQDMFKDTGRKRFG